MDEPMFHVSDGSIFNISYLFGELNLIIIPLANFGVIVQANESMKHSSHKCGESVRTCNKIVWPHEEFLTA